ncbi:MAG: hypothetical protein ACM336_08745 [Acidobacteriota bacterium]
MEEQSTQGTPHRSKEEVALDLMKFVALTTGYGKGTPAAGYTGKPIARPPEEYADALIQLYRRCREAIG